MQAISTNYGNIPIQESDISIILNTNTTEIFRDRGVFNLQYKDFDSSCAIIGERTIPSALLINTIAYCDTVRVYDNTNSLLCIIQYAVSHIVSNRYTFQAGIWKTEDDYKADVIANPLPDIADYALENPTHLLLDKYERNGENIENSRYKVQVIYETESKGEPIISIKLLIFDKYRNSSSDGTMQNFSIGFWKGAYTSTVREQEIKENGGNAGGFGSYDNTSDNIDFPSSTRH